MPGRPPARAQRFVSMKGPGCWAGMGPWKYVTEVFAVVTRKPPLESVCRSRLLVDRESMMGNLIERDTRFGAIVVILV